MSEENTTQEEDFSTQLEENAEQLTATDNSLSNLLKTHKRVNSAFSGSITALEENHSKVNLLTTKDMTTDELGLVHSGFIFSAASYAAAVSINQENTIIIGSKVSFLAPAKVGDNIEFEAKVKFEDLRKREISVIGKINDIRVFQGVFHAVVLEKHIFKTKIKNVKRKY